MIKDKIIVESIKSLQQEGLRFSVDTLAERLNISKKTVYKHFPTKEALAYAMYEKYYADLSCKLKELLEKQPVMTEALLLCYFDSAHMVRKEIFNKYCLNHSIGEFALQHHSDIWNRIKPYICNQMTDEEANIYQLIIDGTFEKIIDNPANSQLAIEMLRKIK